MAEASPIFPQSILQYGQRVLVSRLPSWVFLEYLVDTDLECLIIKAFADVILVYPEFSSSHSFPLRDPGEIKPELPIVTALMMELSVMLH